MFDLDGVIRYWNPEILAFAESASGLPVGAMLEVAFEPILLTSVITGEITDQLWREEVIARLTTMHPDVDCAAAVAAWSEPYGEVIPHALEAVATAREHGVACLLTNATDRLPDDLLKLGILDSFDFIFNSSEIGYAKPDARIFAYVDERLGLLSSKVLFLDDSAANVEAATSHGWDAVLVRAGDDLGRLVADHFV